MNEINNIPARPDTHANRDPITGTLGAHPVGTGLGAVVAGAAAGGAGGAIAGPIGAVAGAAVGAVVGGLVGKASAEAVNPTIETKYWRDTHSSRPYAITGFGYEEYAPAYRYGWESFGFRGGQGETFDSVEADLQNGWDKSRGTSKLGWEHAKEATRDAWNRMRNSVHSDHKIAAI